MSFSVLPSESNDHRNFRGPGEHPITKHMGAWGGGGLLEGLSQNPKKYLFKNSNIRKMLKSYLPYILKYSLSAVDITRFASRLLLMISLATSHSAILYVCMGAIKGTNDVLCIIRLVNDSFEFCPSYASHA